MAIAPVERSAVTCDAGTPLGSCLFIQHCAENAPTLPEPLWHAAASNLGIVHGGAPYFDEISRSHSGYTREATRKKLERAQFAKAPISCRVIEKRGFSCPNMRATVSTPRSVLI
jgi:putative DNA primase/helicase